jgi:hypothetical protein
MKALSEIKVSEVVRDDYEELNRFLVIVFGQEPSLECSLFDHWWERNPSWNNTIPRGWLLRAQNKEIIAFTANIPLPYVIAGRRGVCYANGTTGVHPGWRGKGLAKLVCRPFIEQKVPDFLVVTGSSPIMFVLWRSLGMTSLPLKWPSYCPRVIVSHRRWIEDAAIRKLRVPKFIASSVGVLGLLMDSRSTSSSLSQVTEQISPFESCDSNRLLDCRASCASTYPLRDAKTVNWLYFGNLRQNRLVFTARRDGLLQGFAGFKIIGSSLLLLECRCLGADPNIAADLVVVSGARWRQLGGTNLLVWPYTRMIKAALPRTRNSSVSPMPYVYKTNRIDLIERDWEITPGDGDFSLW